MPQSPAVAAAASDAASRLHAAAAFVPAPSVMPRFGFVSRQSPASERWQIPSPGFAQAGAHEFEPPILRWWLLNFATHFSKLQFEISDSQIQWSLIQFVSTVHLFDERRVQAARKSAHLSVTYPIAAKGILGSQTLKYLRLNVPLNAECFQNGLRRLDAAAAIVQAPSVMPRLEILGIVGWLAARTIVSLDFGTNLFGRPTAVEICLLIRLFLDQIEVQTQ